MRTLTLFTLATLTLSACGGGLNGKSSGVSGLASSNLVSGGPGSNTIASIVSFSPATSNVTSIPTSVTISFSGNALDTAAAGATSTYTVSCGGGTPFAAQSVSAVPGGNAVVVTLPTISGIAIGSSCSLTVSGSLKDGFGNFVNGEHSVTYTLVSSSSGGSGSGSSSSWVEQATAVATAAVGSNVGNVFMGLGANSFALSGIAVNGSTYVDGIYGLWAPFSSSSSTPGQIHGASAGGFTQLTCPAGYRMTGVFGRSGGYIDAIGITCKTEDQSQTYQSSLVGGSGGASFSLDCPAGRFATDLNGRSGNYLDLLYLGCR